MSLLQLQGTYEQQHSIVYEYDSTAPPIGVGGMGNVYAGTCRHLLTGAVREVAIKKLSPLPPHIIEKARREAAIRIKSDNLIEMIAFVETHPPTANGEPQYYVISELLHCVSLADVFKGRFNDFEGRMIPAAQELSELQKRDPSAFAVHVITRVLSGMTALHDQGYIHRDIDPTNIVITNEGHIKLIDFGICKHIGTLNSNVEHELGTVQGTFVGKPEYAAPELIDGLIDSQNYSTDVYAVGVLMYKCLTGDLPFSGSRLSIMQKHRDQKVKVPVKNISDLSMRAIVAKACQKQQQKRYQTATEMRYAIEHRADESRRPLLYMAVIAVMVAIIAVVTFWHAPHKDVVLSPDEVYAEALKMMDSSDADTLRAGVELMDSIAHTGHVEAMYGLSCIYTFLKNDNTNILRQQLLGIDPKTKESEALSLYWLNKVVQATDSAHARALYSLGSYYAAGKGGLHPDLGRASRIFELAGRWALKENDEEIAQKAIVRKNRCDSLIKINVNY